MLTDFVLLFFMYSNTAIYFLPSVGYLATTSFTFSTVISKSFTITFSPTLYVDYTGGWFVGVGVI